MFDASSDQAKSLKDDDLSGARSVGAGSDRLQPLRQTTLDLPPRLQFEAWRDANAGLVEYQTPAVVPDSYGVTSATWRFGGLALLSAETPAGAYRRSAANLRRDGIDLWSFSIATHGHRIYRTRDQITVMRPGQLVLHSLAQSFDTARTQSGWLHLYLPHDEMPNLGRDMSPGCRVLDTPGGRLLRDYLLLLVPELPRMSVADGERMAEVTRVLIALATAPDQGRQEAAAEPIADVQMVRLRNLVRAHIGAATLGPARLCQMAGISRSQLYRLFEPYGGVALFIQSERLNAAYRALSDVNDDRSISDIAEQVGLFDPSSFSRMFRRTFNVSPRELRMARAAGTSAGCRRKAVPHGHPTTFADLLRAI